MQMDSQRATIGTRGSAYLMTYALCFYSLRVSASHRRVGQRLDTGAS